MKIITTNFYVCVVGDGVKSLNKKNTTIQTVLSSTYWCFWEASPVIFFCTCTFSTCNVDCSLKMGFSPSVYRHAFMSFPFHGCHLDLWNLKLFPGIILDSVLIFFPKLTRKYKINVYVIYSEKIIAYNWEIVLYKELWIIIVHRHIVLESRTSVYLGSPL